MKDTQKRRADFRVKDTTIELKGAADHELWIGLDSGVSFRRDRIEHVTRLQFPSRESMMELRAALDAALVTKGE